MVLYLDTSVFGGIFDEEFSEDSSRFVSYIMQGKITIFISRMVLIEIDSAPKHVKKLVQSLPREQIVFLEEMEYCTLFLRRRCALKKSKNFDCVQMKNDIQKKFVKR